jgi:TonB-linked SusC/RagA family outer membrane protein
MKRTIQLLVFSVPAFLFANAVPSLAAGQLDSNRPEGEYREPRFLMAPSKAGAPARPIDIEKTPALARRIAVDLDGATLDEAIDAIATQAGFRIAYAADAVSRSKRVRLRAQSITVAAALTDVLAGAGLDVVFAASGSVALIKRPLPPPTGTVSGTVTDSAGRQALPGVQVRIDGTGRGAVTDENGRYRITGVPVGQMTLTARRLGYSVGRRRLTVVPDTDASADFILAVIPTTLQQVVTTVTGIQRRVEIGNVVGAIQADSLVREAPITSLSSLISGRVSGAQVIVDNGLSGSSPRIRIRGINSFTVSNNPLLVVDGVRVENSTATLGSGYGQTTGRLNDINPEEIESVEIVKGPSAATLYGTDAANGVIVVRTKRGHPGRMAFSVYAETGILQDVTRFQDNYYSWGRNTVTGAAQQCLLVQKAAGTCKVDSLTTFNPLETADTKPFADGSRKQVGLQASGTSGGFSYFLAGEYEGEAGVLHMPRSEQRRISLERGGVAVPDEQIRPNQLRKISLRANGGTSIGSKADVNVTLGLVSSRAALVGDGIVVNAMFGPGYRTPQDGYLSILSRPGEAFAVRNAESVMHYLSGITGNWRPNSWLSTHAITGLDFSSSLLDGLQRRDEGPLGTNRAGRRLNLRTNVSQYSVDIGASATFAPRAGLSSRTSTGIQYNRREQLTTSAVGTGLPPGSETVTGASVITGSEQNIESVVAGAFVEQMVGIRDRLFLTGAVRADGGSAFGSNFSTAAYPKLSLSWLATDQRSGLLNTLRFRAAYGTSGVQPASTAALPRLLLGAGIVEGVSVNGARLDATGNPDLKPERQTEYETGFDVEMLQRRIRLEATYYNRLSRDALVNRPLPSELGIATRQENIGSVRNRGYEGLLSLTPVDNSTMTWDMSFNGSINRNKLEKIGAGIPFIGPNPSSRNVEGYPLFGTFARRILGYFDTNKNGIIEESEIQVGDTLEFVGPSMPPKQLTASSSVTLFHGRVRVATQFDYRGGDRITNFSELNRCSNFLADCRGVNDPNASLAEQAAAVANTSTKFGGTRYGFLADGSFTRWRELSITYRLPDGLTRAFKSTNASATLTGRNLHLFTSFPGVDPESNDAVGLPNVEGYGGNPTPPPVRYWLIRINLGL